MRYIFFICLLLLMSCGRNRFTLDFDLNKEVTENYNVDYYATDVNGGVTVQAVASVREGRCLLDGYTKKPTLVYISRRNSMYPLVVYAEKGKKIKITGNGKDPLAWDVEGKDINGELTGWRLQHFENFTINKKDSVNLWIKDFVENNPQNPLSTVLMLCYYNREIDERGYIELMDTISGEAKKYKWLALASRSDQMSHSYSYPARLESLVMRSNKNGADTLQLNDKEPLLLIFWQVGFTKRKEIVDTLKSLEKEFSKDDLKIADVCVDIDSIGWKNIIKKDSLNLVKRFWTPSGLADKTVMKLKVPASPYYLVFDKEGNQVYRGSDLTEAIKDYRKLKNK